MKTFRAFLQALEASNLTVTREWDFECAEFDGCRRRYGLQFDYVGEWIEVFEFKSGEHATRAFPDGAYRDILGNEHKVAVKERLAMFVWPKHSQWEEIWQVWETF